MPVSLRFFRALSPKFGRSLLHLVLSLLFLLLSITNSAGTPFPTINRSPLIQIYGLPQPVNLNGGGKTTYFLNTAVYNLSSSSSRDSEQILLDGEIYHVDIGANWAATQNARLSVTLPFTGHNGGNGDHFVEQWHKWFGLPNGNRDQRAQDQLLYHYRRDGQTRLVLDRNSSGLGDVKVGWARSLGNSQHSNTRKIFRISIDIPTGSESKLTGSGSWDIASDFTIGTTATDRWPKLSWQASLGIQAMSNQGLLRDIRKDIVTYGSAGAAYALTEKLSARLQFDYHSPFYHSDLPELGRNSTQIVVGGKYRMSKNWGALFYLTEDIEVSTSPDVGVGIQLKYSP